MVPVPITFRHSSRLLYIALSALSQHAPRLLFPNHTDSNVHTLAKRESKFDRHSPTSIVFVVLIPILVLSSGLFAGLTLGYMSLDETQLNVLSISGTPDQRKYANKIKPIRKNGHLLLVTLLLANMIVNESLPVIADPILGGGVQSVVVSTVLIVIFAEIIPQSLFTRHGLYLGAKMAGFTKVLIYVMGVVAWPVAKLLEFVLGSHHGIIYRRAELKELIAMHSNAATHGGDLKTDTVTIIGATLDLQEKVVRQAMTPISDVFMLSIESKLDYALLKKICQTGHSRVPVYEEVDVPVSVVAEVDKSKVQADKSTQRTQKVKKIIGILLVKQCVLLDPKDATPLRKIPLNKVPFVPNNEPLLGILDRFQEGRSHMAIVSRFSVEKAASVKKAVKRGLTQRLRDRVGMGDSDSDSSEEDKEKNFTLRKKTRTRRLLGGSKHSKDIEEGTEDGDTIKETESPPGIAIYKTGYDIEEAGSDTGHGASMDLEKSEGRQEFEDTSGNAPAMNRKAAMGSEKKIKIPGFQLPKVASAMTSMSLLEQSMPADAVLAKEGAAEFLQGYDPAVMPLGIITLEDVLEELIGEEIYDEFDDQGAHGDPYEVPPEDQVEPEMTEVGASGLSNRTDSSRPPSIINTRPANGSIGQAHGQKYTSPNLNAPLPTARKGLGFFRARSAPPVPHDANDGDDGNAREKTVRIDEGANTEIRPGPIYYSSSAAPALGQNTSIQMPRPIRGIGRHPPSVILEQHSSFSSNESGVGLSLSDINPEPPSTPPFGTEKRRNSVPGPGVANATASTIAAPIPVAFSASVGGTPKIPSRTTSPAPSPALEAILLDRKRRLAAVTQPQQNSLLQDIVLSTLGAMVPGGVNSGFTISRDYGASSPASGGGSPVPSGSGGGSTGGSGGASKAGGSGAAGGQKGTRFKSSPLGGVERAGMVVAEQLGAAYGHGKDKEKKDKDEAERK